MSKANNYTKRSSKASKVDGLGQMLASVFWVVSVFLYGIIATGDGLQFCAALS